jgi:Cu(I)/Ag(I) efflux system protein CusF
MKMHTLLFATVLLAGCSQAPSNANDTKAVSTEEAKQPAAEPAPMTSETSAMVTEAAAATKASATGTVEAVDAAAGKITIAHGPVDALQWPAMTMGFKATPEQVASVQVGQKVQFEFESQGMDATITQITPLK